MASREIVQELVELLWSLSGKKPDSKTIAAWEASMRGLDDHRTMTAAYQLLDAWDKSYPPQPADLKVLIPKGDDTNSGSSLDYIMVDNGTCEQCGKSNCRTIKEPKDAGVWLCRYCYTGLTGAEIAARYRALGMENPV